MAKLFKDVTADQTHVATAMGNEKRKPRKATMFSGLTIDAAKAFDKAAVVKVDESLGLVFGFAIVCKQDGEPYFDAQNDHIPEDAMLKAGVDFMLNSRVAKEMHSGGQAGTVVFAFPLTSDIAKALDIETKQTGFLIAMKPDAGMLKRFKSGELTGFSIGGSRIKDEDAA